MKLSFSTLGCPRWNFGEVVSISKDLGFNGIEIRGLGSEMFAPRISEFSPENREKTLKRLADLGLEIPILTSGATLADPDKEKAQAAFVEACAYINLANALGVPYIRVMGTGKPQKSEGNFELGAKLYYALCEYGELFNVTPLIETNGDLSSSDEILKFLDAAGAKNCGVLWDVHHTVVFGEEKPDYTAEKLGKLIKHVHIKDSKVNDGVITYCMMGKGSIPVIDAINELKKLDYKGFISLEWVKRWQPDLQEPGIVFAHYKTYMDRNM
ncbi:MAG: sugar phosphate isomerase/epimerase [Clostridiales bacterium]|nr:sugar phosphate isomerase/epimerase [Clostridiales bacterium]